MYHTEKVSAFSPFARKKTAKKDAPVSLEPTIPWSKVESWSNELKWFRAIPGKKMKRWSSWILLMTSDHTVSVSQKGSIYSARHIWSNWKNCLGHMLENWRARPFELRSWFVKKILVFTYRVVQDSFQIKLKGLLPSCFNIYVKLCFQADILCGSP